MTPAPLSRLCIHTATTKPLALPDAIAAFQNVDAAGITVWRDALTPLGLKESARLLADSPLKVVSLCRGGFFPALTDAARRAAFDDNRRAIDEAAAIHAPLVVLVCGALPGMPLPEARKQITDAIATLIPHARQANVKLAIEPLHPMYAADRSAVNTITQANDMVADLASPHVGVALDVYHVWWDDRLQSEIRRCATLNALLAFHVCDWRPNTRDLLLDRGLMGEGCIPLRQIRSWVEAAGYSGMIEVEIFSTERWKENQIDYLQKIRSAYLEHV